MPPKAKPKPKPKKRAEESAAAPATAAHENLSVQPEARGKRGLPE